MNAPSWFNTIGEKTYVKTDSAIYCLVLGASGPTLDSTVKRWILVPVRRWLVFQNTVTYA